MFSSGISTGAFAVLALFAGNAVAGATGIHSRYTNGTTANIPNVGDEVAVGGRIWQYDGCLGSQSSFSSFSIKSTTSNNTVEGCLASCSTSRFAGLYQGSCYCANVIDAASSIGSGVCNLPCPGNPLEACGGNAAVSKRQIDSSFLLSLWEAISTSIIVEETTNVNIVTPAAGSLTVITYVNTYFDVCGCAAGLAQYTTTTAITYAHCGCTSSAAPTVPMTTTTKVCDTCGTNGTPATVTLTLPCTATGTGSAVYYNGTCVGSGCPVTSSGPSVTTVTVSACPATATATTAKSGVASASTAVTTTIPASSKYTGAASANKVGGVLMAAGIAAALL